MGYDLCKLPAPVDCVVWDFSVEAVEAWRRRQKLGVMEKHVATGAPALDTA